MRVVAAFVALLILVPVLAVVTLLSVDPYEPPRDDPAASVFVPIGLDRPVATLPARMALAWDPPLHVFAQGTQGTVTSIHVITGSTVTSGTAVFDVNGSTVVAAGPQTVLWRDLSLGDTGRDVVSLAAFLDSLGLIDGELTPPLDRVGPQLSAAIDRFLVEFSWPRVLRSGSTGTGPVFPVSALLYVGFDQFVVDDVNLVVGQPVPAAGQPVMSSGSTIVAASVMVDEPVDVPGGTSAFRTINGNLEIELLPDGTVPPSILSTIQASVEPGVMTLDGIMTIHGVETYFVPASAVVIGASTECVWGSGGSRRVSVVWSQGGRAYVTSPTELPNEVIANPIASLPDPSCS